MGGWPHVPWELWFHAHNRPDPWDALERVRDTNIVTREGGGAREDRLRHRWRLLEIAEKTGQTVEEVRIRFGLRRAV